ncbi:hypothetical protein PMAYCL1PPCAC_25177, partial [Pristionchus mayeri]
EIEKGREKMNWFKDDFSKILERKDQHMRELIQKLETELDNKREAFKQFKFDNAVALKGKDKKILGLQKERDKLRTAVDQKQISLGDSLAKNHK